MNTGHLITSYGYWALFTLVAIESPGIPLTGETALVIAGAYARTTHRLSPWLIFPVASAAAATGDSIGYWIGNRVATGCLAATGTGCGWMSGS
jgi:membrane protein DedA with SNARE-associated domain